jgi:hypothetical protein
MLKFVTTVVAAAAFCAVGPAHAATVSIHFNGFCNGLNITTAAHHIVSTVENGCAAGFGGGVGVLGTIDGIPGKHYSIGENYDDGDGSYGGEEFWTLSAPLVSGGTYVGWRHKSCCGLVKFASGTYSVIGAAGSPSDGPRLVAPK